MASPHVSESFGDLLDTRFQKIFYENLPQLEPMITDVYTMVGSNGREDMRFSQVGTLADWDQFSGTVNYTDSSQGFDTVLTPLEFASGVQVERKLFDNDQYNIMDQRPKSLATSWGRTREKHAARLYNNAFSIDTLFYVNSENVALCSNSHTTNSGASTSSGFDNLGTAALTAAAVASARITMRGFRGDQAERINIVPDMITIPPDLYEEGFEIINAKGKVDTAENNPNVHNGVYGLREWNYLTDTNNWFLEDGSMRKESVFWSDRIPVEFAFAEDLDTLIAKWSGYGVYGAAHIEWRWVFGHQVS